MPRLLPPPTCCPQTRISFEKPAPTTVCTNLSHLAPWRPCRLPGPLGVRARSSSMTASSRLFGNCCPVPHAPLPVARIFPVPACSLFLAQLLAPRIHPRRIHANDPPLVTGLVVSVPDPVPTCTYFPTCSLRTCSCIRYPSRLPLRVACTSCILAVLHHTPCLTSLAADC